jgi:hypothetical protein
VSNCISVLAAPALALLSRTTPGRGYTILYSDPVIVYFALEGAYTHCAQQERAPGSLPSSPGAPLSRAAQVGRKVLVVIDVDDAEVIEPPRNLGNVITDPPLSDRGA